MSARVANLASTLQGSPKTATHEPCGTPVEWHRSLSASADGDHLWCSKCHQSVPPEELSPAGAVCLIFD